MPDTEWNIWIDGETAASIKKAETLKPPTSREAAVAQGRLMLKAGVEHVVVEEVTKTSVLDMSQEQYQNQGCTGYTTTCSCNLCSIARDVIKVNERISG